MGRGRLAKSIATISIRPAAKLLVDTPTPTWPSVDIAVTSKVLSRREFGAVEGRVGSRLIRVFGSRLSTAERSFESVSVALGVTLFFDFDFISFLAARDGSRSGYTRKDIHIPHIYTGTNVV